MRCQPVIDADFAPAGKILVGLLRRTRQKAPSCAAEREAALEMLGRRRIAPRRITLGADKAYDVTAFVGDLRARKITPHIAIDGHLTKTGKRRKTAIDGRTAGHAGYAVSQRCRKRIEEVFGWIKASAGQAKTKFRGVDRVRSQCLGAGGLQPDPIAQAAGGADMTTPSYRQTISRPSQRRTMIHNHMSKP